MQDNQLNNCSSSGGNPNCEDCDGRTPLHSAIVKGSRSYECVRMLLDGGSDVNHKDRCDSCGRREAATETNCICTR